ncbi:hypothetical protein J4440_05335 [Candidatus Woesearchaeota archaeon]|nr:hypothetical protein [Candidatus Woesearchaeota archaeon]
MDLVDRNVQDILSVLKTEFAILSKKPNRDLDKLLLIVIGKIRRDFEYSYNARIIRSAKILADLKSKDFNTDTSREIKEVKKLLEDSEEYKKKYQTLLADLNMKNKDPQIKNIGRYNIRGYDDR